MVGQMYFDLLLVRGQVIKFDSPLTLVNVYGKNVLEQIA